MLDLSRLAGLSAASDRRGSRLILTRTNEADARVQQSPDCRNVRSRRSRQDCIVLLHRALCEVAKALCFATPIEIESCCLRKLQSQANRRQGSRNPAVRVQRSPAEEMLAFQLDSAWARRLALAQLLGEPVQVRLCHPVSCDVLLNVLVTGAPLAVCPCRPVGSSASIQFGSMLAFEKPSSQGARSSSDVDIFDA